jgi:hypothetical protein
VTHNITYRCDVCPAACTLQAEDADPNSLPTQCPFDAGTVEWVETKREVQ